MALKRCSCQVFVHGGGNLCLWLKSNSRVSKKIAATFWCISSL